MANSVHTISFRRDIQGLRAVAIALVVLAHAHVPGFAGGFVGIDVFFVAASNLEITATHGTAR
jgi:peptidoglycan/LPS O-acetylase OafA/YrhL